MAHAMLYPEPAKAGRKKAGQPKNDCDTQQFSTALLSRAREVLKHSTKLACAVRDGSMSLDDALEQVRDGLAWVR